MESLGKIASDRDGGRESLALSSEMTKVQARYLARGMTQPGGKLPLFDEDGQRVKAGTVHACIDRGWAEPWYRNPIKPDWLVCKLTKSGRRAVSEALMPGASRSSKPNNKR